MSQPNLFLLALGHALDAWVRFPPGHPGRSASGEEAAKRLIRLTHLDPTPRFRFGAPGVDYGHFRLHELADWEWAARLASIGVERLDLSAPVPAASLAAFLDAVAGALPRGEAPGVVAPASAEGLAWGRVEGSGPEGPAAGAGAGAGALRSPYPLDEELAVARSLFVRAARGEPLNQTDVSALVAALQVALRANGELVLPLLQPASRAHYQPTHALNTTLLALALAEWLGLAPPDVRSCGLAGLLHDIGMVRVPAEGLAGEALSAADRARMRSHPVEGARLLLRHGDGWELAAVAAYEHHLRADGGMGGYPRMSYPREPHPVSRVVAVCDAYDALLAERPDRPGYAPDEAVRQLAGAAGSQFDLRIARAFRDMLQLIQQRGALVLTSRVK
jgi:putative nucleotidyltransferase with HDIG domain